MYHVISITGLIVNDSAGELSFGGVPNDIEQDAVDVGTWSANRICVAAVRDELRW